MTTLGRPQDDWYVPLAAHLGEAYLQYAFTAGTVQEVDFIAQTLFTHEGERLLDVGCGPGRHVVEFARRGLQVVGVDISPEFIALAHQQAAAAGVQPSLFQMDARQLPFENDFDVVICLNEGGFGLGLPDLEILRNIRRAMRPGGRLVLGAGNVFYVLKHGPVAGWPVPEGEIPEGSRPASGELDPVTMRYRARVEGVVGDGGATRDFDVWTSLYTPRELEWIANGAGLDPEVVFGVRPGAYAREVPTFDHPELLLVARKKSA